VVSLIDTHCHLDFNYFDKDRDQVLERAWEAGVRRIVNPSIDLESCERILSLAESEPRVFAAVGVHPNDAQVWEAGTLDRLREMAKHPQVVAIGEIGLDYYWDTTPPELQHEIFQAQLELAAELNLPVILHTRNKSGEDRRAMADMLERLGRWQAGLQAAGSPLAERPGVLHSFSDGLEPALRAAGHNFYIGITGPVTFRKASELREVAAALPLERLLLETDAPFLTPHPHRGERNEPAYVSFVAEKIAEIHGLPLEAVAQATTGNAGRLFNWRDNA
jgi:TatD DNase family protein